MDRLGPSQLTINEICQRFKASMRCGEDRVPLVVRHRRSLAYLPATCGGVERSADGVDCRQVQKGLSTKKLNALDIAVVPEHPLNNLRSAFRSISDCGE